MQTDILGILMKKRLVFLPIAFLVLAFFVLYTSVSHSDQALTETLDRQVLGDRTYDFIDLKNGDEVYRVIWFFADTSNLRLISNLQKKDISQDLVDQNKCINAVNGGFYDVSDVHLGLLVSNSKTISLYQKNSLLNGILSINQMDTPRITRDVPQDPLVNAVQSGPILMENAKVMDLNLARDKKARRMVAAVTGNNQLIFASIYDPESQLSGPTLDSLPSLVYLWGRKVNLELADAINLDGGSASAFYLPGKVLKEASPVGSLFCITSGVEEK